MLGKQTTNFLLKSLEPLTIFRYVSCVIRIRHGIHFFPSPVPTIETTVNTPTSCLPLGQVDTVVLTLSVK